MPAAVDDEIDLGPEAPSFPPLPAPVQPVPDSPVPGRSGPIPAPPIMPAPPQPLQGVIPAQTFDDPRYQQQVERETMAIAQRAKSYDQAQHDVSSARRILGMLKADRERQTMERAGVPPGEAMQKAMFQNMQFFVQPGDKNFAQDFKAIQPPRPVPSPTAMNLPGLPPGVVDARGVPHWPSAAEVKANAPPTEYLPKEVEYDGEKWLVNTHTGHFVRKDKPEAVMTPYQMQQGLIAESHITERLYAAATDKKEKERLRAQLEDNQKQLQKFRAPKPNATPPPTGNKVLTRESAAGFLQQAGGDKEKARKMARDAGFSF